MITVAFNINENESIRVRLTYLDDTEAQFNVLHCRIENDYVRTESLRGFTDLREGGKLVTNTLAESGDFLSEAIPDLIKARDIEFEKALIEERMLEKLKSAPALNLTEAKIGEKFQGADRTYIGTPDKYTLVGIFEGEYYMRLIDEDELRVEIFNVEGVCIDDEDSFIMGRLNQPTTGA